jgi:hypothetical protein
MHTENVFVAEQSAAIATAKSDYESERNKPMPLDYLMSVTVTRGILFAAISFEITGFETNPGDITHLWPSDAAKAKRYIMGLIEAKKENIDLSPVKPSEIRDHVEEIGRSTGDIETLPIS